MPTAEELVDTWNGAPRKVPVTIGGLTAAEAALVPDGFVFDPRPSSMNFIAQGGTGQVFWATYLGPRKLAIKLFHADEFKHRYFYREVEAWKLVQSQLGSHYNVVEIYKAGLLEGNRAYLAMELLEGQMLDRAARDVPPPRRLWWMHDVLEGLTHLHGAVVHRDIKPANVMVTIDGRAIIVDLGLILKIKFELPAGVPKPRRGSDHDIMLTQETGYIHGTPIYMSPQQATGARPTPADDVYAAGVTMYEILGAAVQPLWNGLSRIQSRAAGDLGFVPPKFAGTMKFGDELDKLLAEMVSFDPALRPTAAECAERLEPLIG